MNLDDYNEQCRSCYMLGILATRRMMSPIKSLGEGGAIVANIQAISVEPELLVKNIKPNQKSDYYMAIDNEQVMVDIPKNYSYMDQAEKVEFWDETLKDSIILFTPKFKTDTMNDGKIIKNIRIEHIEEYDGGNWEDEYVPIPILDLDNTEFEAKLSQGKAIHLNNYNHSMYMPEYIICNDYIYFNFQEWDKSARNPNYWICSREPNRVEKLEVNINTLEHIIVNDNFIFMRRSLLMAIEEDSSAEKISLVTGKGEEKKEVVKIIKLGSGKTEIDFLDSLKEETLRSGLSYSVEDLVNLHTCIKTNPLTILSGMSGTGKTKLANIYSKVLNCSEEEGTLLFLPINPSYTEPGDLLGYLNNTNGIYMPSETRLVDFLNNANEHRDRMHIVIFDEMNLAQVEYWFAPFISLLEMEVQDRKLSLYSPQANCINKHLYKPTIQITDNIRFIGTVNVDETTKDFSDRLLDRANIIILEKQSFQTLKDEILDFDKNKGWMEEGPVTFDDYGSYKDYLGWINEDNWLSAYRDIEIELFDELHEIINKYDLEKGVSFRIVRKIGEYLNNIPRNSDSLLLNRGKAFDLQVKQRIITKLKGSEKQFGKLIGTKNDYDQKSVIDSELLDFFGRAQWEDISDFKLTKDEIKKKAKELGVYGYAN